MDHRQEQKIIKDFGKRLRQIRQEKGLSLRDLADLADMNHGNIGKIERGETHPHIATAVLLARALEVDPGELFAFPR